MEEGKCATELRSGTALGLLACFMCCPVSGGGKGCAYVGGIILEEVLVNYCLLKHHLGDILSLSCSLIFHAVKGNSSIVH